MSDEKETGSGGHSGNNTAIFAALAANLGIAVTKIIAWLLTGMSSMLAEGIHSAADSGNQILLLIGGKKAQKDADEDHPFGYGRERYLAGFVVSIIVFSLGGLFSLFEAYEKFHQMREPGAKQPSTDEAWWWVPIVVLVLAILMEGRSLMTAAKGAREQKGEQSWGQFLKSAKSPELPVLLCEDSAAVTGLVFALVGISLALVTQNGIWDAVGAGLIGILLILVAIFLFRETKSMLLGEAATPETVRDIRRAIESADGVNRVIHMKTSHLGPEELLVAVKFAVDKSDTGEEIAHAIDMAEQAARAAKPDMQLLMYLEPDIDLGRVGSRIGHRSSVEHTDLPDERVNDGGSTKHGATRIEG